MAIVENSFQLVLKLTLSLMEVVAWDKAKNFEVD